jgi:predicted nucleic acid-binding Zn ribbon protein
MEKADIRKIRDVLQEFLRENKLDVKLRERGLIDSWEELMGKTISRATKKIYIKEGKLFIVISSSVIRNELYMLKQEIVRKLNEKAGEDIITELVLR